MKWHDHSLLIKSAASMIGMSWKDSQPAEIANRLSGAFVTKGGKGSASTSAQVAFEAIWCQDDRPYYDLYPSVAEALIRVDLDKLMCEQLHLPLKALMVRLPVGHELELSPRMKMRTLLVGEQRKPHRAWMVMINDGSIYEGLPINTVAGARLDDGTTLYSHLIAGRQSPYCDDVIDEEAVDNAFRLVATLCLLKDDPDLIAPLPLAADIDKWNATHDMALIEKAARRGKRAWAVGRDIEVAPGFRRPHFAIRWCGKGRTDPRLRPIKGCLVHRKKIEEVPTDWLGPDDVVDAASESGTIHAS